MTTTHSSVERGTGNYFRFLLRQNWFAFVTNAIIYLILNVVILSMVLTEVVRGAGDIADVFEGFKTVNVVVTSLLAVLWGVNTMGYLNTKIGVNFYHSLPLTRESLYFTEIFVKMLSVFLPLTISNLMAACLGAMYNGGWDHLVAGHLRSGVFYSAVYFFLFFGIMMFSASFTGTGFARIMTAGTIVFMPMILCYCLALILSFRAEYTDYGWMTYLGENLFVPLRALSVSLGDNDCIAREMVWTLVIGTLFYFFGILIYRKRKSELSGTPILGNAGIVTVKYSCLWAAATFSGMIFSDMAGGQPVWFVVGALVGALLCSMLLNTILLKSARWMFHGIRGLGVFCGVFLTCFILFGLDVVGLDRHVPDVDSLQSVRVVINSEELELDILDREEMESILELIPSALQKQEKIDRTVEMTEIPATTTELEYSAQNSFSVVISCRAKWNPFATKRIRLVVPMGGELLSAIADLSGFSDAWFGRVAEDEPCSVIFSNTLLYAGLDSTLDGRLLREYPEVLREQREQFTGSAWFQQPSLGCLYVRNEGEETWRSSISFPYYGTTAETASAAAESIARVVVVKHQTGETVDVTDRETICTFLQNAVLEDSNALMFTAVNTEYSLALELYERGSESWVQGRFLAGYTPELPS